MPDTLPFSPKLYLFARAELLPLPGKKSKRCQLTDAKIAPGQMVYLLQNNEYSDGDPYFMLQEAADKDEKFCQSLKNLHKRSHCPVDLFYSEPWVIGALDPGWQEHREEVRFRWRVPRYLARILAQKPEKREPKHYTSKGWMTLEELQEEAAKPPPPQRGQLDPDALWDRVWRLLHTWNDEPQRKYRDKLWYFLGCIVMCEFRTRMLARYDELTPELQLMMACSNDLTFQDLAEKSGLLPHWSTVRALVCKSRTTLEDMLALAAWGKAHPEALQIIWKTYTGCGILSFAIMPPLGFSDMFKSGHSAYLLFLFAARPDLCPMLQVMDPEKCYTKNPELKDMCEGLVSSLAYHYIYLYRAKIFEYLLAGKVEEARRVLPFMRKNASFYFHGDPTGFINATEKFVEQYAKKYAQ